MDTFTWKTSPFSWTLAEELARGLEVPMLAGIVLARRGFMSVPEARAFIEVDSRVPPQSGVTDSWHDDQDVRALSK